MHNHDLLLTQQLTPLWFPVNSSSTLTHGLRPHHSPWATQYRVPGTMQHRMVQRAPRYAKISNPCLSSPPNMKTQAISALKHLH
mmetsp:Transcript_19225/g.34000  ORF Transcript_19225/g.34000 Transcript_19225/m.34000 type:complete len:84 (-) Transcript_19225:273-524(-)